MKTRRLLLILGLAYCFHSPLPASPVQDQALSLLDVFELEYVSDPQISPDGARIVYVRNFMDIMKDTPRSNLWIIQRDGSSNRPLTTGNRNDFSPRWSPDGKQMLYLSRSDGSVQIFLLWIDTGSIAKLTNLTAAPFAVSWSPDGRWIVFSMLVPQPPAPFVDLPDKPEGAEWAKPARVIDRVKYRADGTGYLKEGYYQLFLLSVDGGTARQLTDGPYHHRQGARWAEDGSRLIFSANRHEGWEYDPRNSELYELSLSDLSIRSLTNRKGPDISPEISPDGSKIAFLGYDDRYQGHQTTRLYVMNHDGTDPQVVTAGFDRDIQNPRWNSDSTGLFFKYDEHGNGKIGFVSLKGSVRTLAHNVGGTTLGRPYASGSFSVAGNGCYAFTETQPDHPSDLCVGCLGESGQRRLTRVNQDLLGFRNLAALEEIWFSSTYDGRRIQGWIVKPPSFDPNRKYPLILEIHGGPFADYGDRFAMEMQLYAAAGYVVFYANPRGSTGYGEEFGNLIHHAYPGHDYDDLMSGVDAVLSRGYVDRENLFVTGGSGGGVLTSWIVGKTDRFRAAVVAKPVINWYSFVLTADNSVFFYKYWFPGFPWDFADHYLERSPLSLVGNVSTPTMIMTGEVDYRTPISESEQYYEALKLRKVDTVMVRIPEASHGIATRPSNLMSKVAHVLKWFKTHRYKKE